MFFREHSVRIAIYAQTKSVGQETGETRFLERAIR